MTQTCRPAKCIEAIRIALLDQCTLLPVCGPLNGYAMGCVIDVDWNPEIEEGDESIVKNDCGDICWRDDRCDLMKRINGEFKIAGPDPEFEALIGGDNLIVVEGQSVGVQKLSQHCSPWLFLELFERTDECDTEGEPVYLRHVFPRARLTWTGNEKEGIFRLLQIEFKALDIPVADIGDGPYNDIPAEAIIAPPNARTPYIWFADATVPNVQCGAIEVPCIEACTEPLPTGATAPAPCTICIQGSCFLTADSVTPSYANAGDIGPYYDPAGPNAGLNDPAWVITWSDTEICITDDIDSPIQDGDVLEQATFFDEFAVPFLPFYTFAPSVPTIECAPILPEITDGVSNECECITLTGTNLDLLNRITENNCLGASFYDPAGPDAGLNPVGAVISTWNATTIEICWPGFASGGCAGGWEGYGVGNTPYYDQLNQGGDINQIDPCSPGLSDARSNFCSEYQIILDTAVFVIDHIEINGIDYYDPAGPNAGLNPVGVTFGSWGPTNFVIHDETNLCGLVDGFTLYELGDPVAYPFTGQGDQVYCGTPFGCPVNVGMNSTDCETFCFTADSGLLGVNRINIGLPSSNYWNPAGPDAGNNSGTTIILSWTDTEICIQDTAINATISNFGNIDFYDVNNGRHFIDGGGGFDGVTIQPCPPNTPIIEQVTAPECYTIDIVGSGFSFADRLEVESGGPNFYDPAGPNNGLNPVDAVFNFWTDTHIQIVAPAELVGTVDNVAFYDTSNVLIQDYDSFPQITLEACPILTSGSSENCEEFVLYGFGFNLVNHIAVQTTSPAAMIDYYDPAGPDNGLNPGTATILSWTATEIRILDTQFSGHNLVNVQMWGVGDTPDYGIYDLSSFPVDDCADLPAVTGSDSPDCQQLRVSGGRFDLVDHIVVVTDSGTLDYYDPAGPNSGLNPVTSQNIAWTPSNIQVYDTTIGGFTVQTVQLFDVGDVTDYGTFDVADYLIDSCPPPSAVSGNDSGVDRFQIHGTGFDSVNILKVITLGPTSDYEYFDPNGPNAAFNPGFVTVLSWTDTLIEIQHTGIGATITDVHLYGCCGPAAGATDYGNFDITNFVVT